MTTYLIDRSTMVMTTYGPEPVPLGTPTDLALRWEPATQTVYAEISPDLYPFLRMKPEPHYVIGEPTISPLHTAVADDSLFQVINGAASFVMHFPFQHAAVEGSTIADDGTVWFIASTVDRTTTDTVHFWLAHFDATTESVQAVDLPPTHAATVPLARLETVRRLTVQGSRATVMAGTQNGLVLASYQF